MADATDNQEGGDGAVPVKSFHHGDLRQALLAAAEDILDTEGIAALTLRAAARAVGVSHAAPKNHFGDMTGLLSDLAAIGYDRFSDQLSVSAQSQETPKTRLLAIGHAYVDFAEAFPGLFLLMFRSERLDLSRPRLKDAMDRAFEVLQRSVTHAEIEPSASSPIKMAAKVTRAWAVAHGLAMLQLDHRLARIVSVLPTGTSPHDLVAAVLELDA